MAGSGFFLFSLCTAFDLSARFELGSLIGDRGLHSAEEVVMLPTQQNWVLDSTLAKNFRLSFQHSALRKPLKTRSDFECDCVIRIALFAFQTRVSS